jgi:hypothetical protein
MEKIVNSISTVETIIQFLRKGTGQINGCLIFRLLVTAESNQYNLLIQSGAPTTRYAQFLGVVVVCGTAK